MATMLPTPAPTPQPPMPTGPSPEPEDGPCVPQYGQCGGRDYTGPTQCEAGLVCKVLTEWWHQCDVVPALVAEKSGKDISRHSHSSGYRTLRGRKHAGAVLLEISQVAAKVAESALDDEL